MFIGAKHPKIYQFNLEKNFTGPQKLNVWPASSCNVFVCLNYTNEMKIIIQVDCNSLGHGITYAESDSTRTKSASARQLFPPPPSQPSLDHQKPWGSQCLQCLCTSITCFYDPAAWESLYVLSICSILPQIIQLG